MRYHSAALVAALALMVVTFTVGMILHHRVLSTLRENHPEVWKDLGSPTVLANNSIKNSLEVLSFLRAGKAKEMDDPVLAKYARRLRVVTVVHCALFAAFLIGFIWQVALG